MNDYRNRVSPPRERVKIDYNSRSFYVEDITPGGVQVTVVTNAAKQAVYTKLMGVWVQTDSGNLEKLPEASREMNIILDEVVRVAWGTQIK